MKTYRVWTGCGGWKRVTTSKAVWAATPRFKGLAIAIGCAGGVLIGGGIGISRGDYGPGPHWPSSLISGGGASERWQVVQPSPPVHVPEPGTIELLIAGGAGLAVLRRRGK